MSEYKKFLIKNFTYGKIELHSNQSYLGRSLIILKRHLMDLFDISKEEEEGLFIVTKNLRNTLKKTFNPELLNYALLGNESRHVHLHVVPRYSKPVSFHKFNFEDNRWGKNYSGYDKKFTISESLQMEIKNALQLNLK